MSICRVRATRHRLSRVIVCAYKSRSVRLRALAPLIFGHAADDSGVGAIGRERRSISGRGFGSPSYGFRRAHHRGASRGAKLMRPT
eukprot:2884663-Prymnesium_polylepis.1